MFYPIDGSSGTIDVCVNLPRTSPGQNFGVFELFDPGDFNAPTIVGNDNVICQTISYPTLDEDNEPIGYEVLSFYVVPIKEDTVLSIPIVQSISGELTLNGQTCDCDDAQSEISFGFTGRNNIVFGDDVTYNAPQGIDLSTLVNDPDCFLLSCFQDPSVSGSTEVAIIFDGILNVDIDYELGSLSSTRKSSLTLAPNAKINVLNGSTLTIQNTEVAGCRAMWDAITVEDGGELILDRSRIKDGDNAITVEENGTLLVKETEFKNFHRGIFASVNSNTSLTRADVSVFGSTFDFKTSDGLYSEDDGFLPAPRLLPPYAGQIPAASAVFQNIRSGITFAAIPLGSSNFGSRFNRIQNMENGIVFNNSAGVISGTRIFDIVDQGSSATGNGLYLIGDEWPFLTTRQVKVFAEDGNQGGVEISRMTTGFRLRDGSNLFVRDAVITDVENGLYDEGGKRIRFFENYVESSQNGFYRILDDFAAQSLIRGNTFIAGGNLQESLGIGLIDVGVNTAARHEIRKNVVTLAGAQYGLFSVGGRRVSVTGNEVDWSGNMFGTKGMVFVGGDRRYVRGNLISGNTGQSFTETTGMEFIGVDRPLPSCNTLNNVETGMFFFGNNQGSSVRGNEFQDAGIGLQLGYDLPFVDDPTIIGEQIHHGNRWTGTYQGFGAAFFNSSFSDREESRFTVSPTTEGTLLPPSINPSAQIGWFIVAPPTTATYTCPDGLPPSGNLNQLGDSITNFAYVPPGSWLGTVRDASHRLYRAEALGEVQSTLFSNWNAWLAHPTNSSIPDFYDYEALMTNLPGVDSSRQATIDNLDGSVSSLMDSFFVETVKVYFDSTVNVAAVQATRSMLLDSIETIDIAAEALRDTLTLNHKANLQAASDILNMLPTTTIPESNLVAVDSFLYRMQVSGIAFLKNYESAIVAIAEQCPLDGGEAVYRARALAYGMGSSLAIDSLQNCGPTTGGDTKELSKPTPGALTVFPNPAQAEINVSSESTISEVLLHDMTGRLLLRTKNASKGKQVVTLPTSGLTPGVYLLEVLLVGEETEKQLIIIQ